MRLQRTATAVLLAVGSLLTGSLAATTAGAAPAPTPTTSFQHHEAAEGFWTADRMRHATPLDLDLSRSGAKAVKTPSPGAERSVVSPTVIPQPGGPWTGNGAVVKTTGRVFFTFEGRTASCSGSSVTSQNGSTVLTAGHCVKYRGAWHTNWVFVPAYNDGQAPYGQWSATKTLATDQWAASEDINYDVGAAVVAPLNGKKLAETVGAQGLEFNGAYGRAMYAFGYPAASPYDGKKLIYCSGTAGRDPLGMTKDHGLGCNMTGGSSGGPWFTSFNESAGTGLQASVNSFGYTFLPNRMFGPYFGNEAKAVYDKAQTS
ncbi:trypsin-like serine peptidase [Streptomyces sp. NPDC059002]|uniref:trypsin-like serine peptidase n=1 Tax=Streptomyces sp. NPDC059002 TaxID=3346690 RepID=UPI0036C9642F